MMARGFKPVGWVAGVGAAALGCYMLSLNVASERAELAKLERSIIAAKRDIRTLQTELGTRGRLQQLENWNANVLALSAPTSAQFLDSEVTLARFDQREQTIEEKSVVHMASAPAPAEAPKVEQKIEAPVRYASAPAADKPAAPLVHQASLVIGEEKAAPAPEKKFVREARKPEPAKTASAEKKPEPAKKAASAEKKTASAEKKAEPAKKPAPVKTASADKKPEPAKKAPAEKAAKEKTAAKSAKAGNAVGQ